jgi:methylenetetrahydrofolate dehydrogenase (NADP+)/methenyltetrahydrofolate cyclohydrolase
VLHFDDALSQDDLIREIQTLNNDTSVTGILVQSPLPSHMKAQEVFNIIHPLKDVDGFSAANITQLYSGDETGLVPCTPKGIMKIIEHFSGNISGKKVVVIGKSTIVGKPLAMMLLNAGATVTVCHSRTTDLQEHTLQADIVISAVGKKHLITSEMVQE